MTRYDVWIQVPMSGKLPWSCIARNVSEEQMLAYFDTLLFPAHVEETTASTRREDSAGD